MIRSPRQRRLYFGSVVFATLPILFALIRAFTSNHDLRMLWMAFASFLGAALVMGFGKARRRARKVVVALSAVALVVATIFAALTAIGFGATAPFGIWAVAFVLGSCWAVSYALGTLSRQEEV